MCELFLSHFQNPFYTESRISPSPPFRDRETEVDWREYLQFSRGSTDLEKMGLMFRVLELAAVIKLYRSFWILWTTWTLVLPNLLIFLSVDESSHEQFNSSELEFMALMLDWAQHLNIHSSHQSAPLCSEVRRFPHQSSVLRMQNFTAPYGPYILVY